MVVERIGGFWPQSYRVIEAGKRFVESAFFTKQDAALEKSVGVVWLQFQDKTIAVKRLVRTVQLLENDTAALEGRHMIGLR